MSLNDAALAAWSHDPVAARMELAKEAARMATPAEAGPEPVGTSERSQNELRPNLLEDVIGQESAKRVVAAVIDQAKRTKTPLDHVLLVGPSGTGKSTFSHVIANELGVNVYEVEAPVSRETLLQLRTVMKDRDILRIEEIHQQAIQERRGRTSSTEPEVLYNVLEDRTIVSGSGVLPFPAITVIGTTTDEGLLPDPFLNRFPLRPRLVRYSRGELIDLGGCNANALGMSAEVDALALFADASRGTPRAINNYVRNARALTAGKIIDLPLAQEVVFNLNGTTFDGLTPDMQEMLVYLLRHGRRENAKGDVTYQASLGSIATGIGKSRDSKAIQLRVESHLIVSGLIEVAHGGRRLTDAGIERAQELIDEAT